jgi:hypothetical protein
VASSKIFGGVPSGRGRWSPSGGQRPALPWLGVVPGKLLCAVGGLTAGAVAESAGASRVGLPQRAVAPFTGTQRHGHHFFPCLLCFVTGFGDETWTTGKWYSTSTSAGGRCVRPVYRPVGVLPAHRSEKRRGQAASSRSFWWCAQAVSSS